jgi:hypothetical protein
MGFCMVKKKIRKIIEILRILLRFCGDRGIRTLGTVASTPAFQAGSFDHSDISPDKSMGGKNSFFVVI